MTTHEFREEHSQQWSGVCVECVLKPGGPLDSDRLADTVDYLINLVPELSSHVRRDRRHACHPVVCELPGGMRMSERSLWSLVFENMDDAGPLVARYVNALCDEFPNKDGLEHLYPTEPYYCAGARALYGYFDHLEDRDELRNPENIPVFKAFRRYLDCVDMDHEVYEEDYISLVLKSGLRHLEPREMYLDLLHFRLMYGQAALGNRPYEDIAAIVKFGDLKPLVDFHIASVKKQVESGEYVEDWEFDEYRLLIAAIYGSDEKPARDVLEYVESRTGKAVPAAEEFRLEDIESLAAARDIFLEHYSGDGKRFANTGFHWFNTETRTWEKVAS